MPAGSLLANRGPDYSGAALMCNLLPTIGQSKDASLSAGIYVGEGLLPVPAKLAEKITRWEFVEMAELLPEFWSTPSPKEPSPVPPCGRVRHGGGERLRTLLHGYNVSQPTLA